MTRERRGVRSHPETLGRAELTATSIPDPFFTPQVCGTLLWAGWVLLTLLSSGFAWGVPALDRPVLVVTLILIALSIVHLYAVALVRRSRSPKPASISQMTIIGFALAMRFVAVFSTPIQELDYYRYLWDGETVLAGANPFHVTPEQALDVCDQPEQAIDGFAASAAVKAVAEVCRQRPRVRETAARVHYGELPTIYPPVSLAVFAAATAVTPESVSLETAVVILRLPIVLFDVGIIFWLIRLLKHIGWNPELVISYAWCPLIVKEFANSGHLDAIAVFFMMGSLTTLVVRVFPALTEAQTASSGRAQALRLAQQESVTSSTLDGLRSAAISTGDAYIIQSAVMMGLAIGAKLFPVILMPLLAGLVLRRMGLKTTFIWGATSGVLSVLCCWPMIQNSLKVAEGRQPSGESHASSDRQRTARAVPLHNSENGADTGRLAPFRYLATAANKPPAGDEDVPPPVPDEVETVSESDAVIIATQQNSLKVFLMSWKMNDLIFLLFESNLTPTSRQYQNQDQWFVVLPNSFRDSVTSLATSRLGLTPEFAPFLLSRAVLSATFFVMAMYWAWRGMSKIRPDEWLELAFVTVAWFWVLSPTLNPWYWTWAMPLVLFARNRAWHLVSAIVFVYYLRFWFACQWGEEPVWGTRYQGEAFFHYVVVWIEHLPWMTLLVWNYFLAAQRKPSGVDV
jgi:hypothetical protein